MQIVIDASALLKAYFPDEEGYEKAQDIVFDRCRTREIVSHTHSFDYWLAFGSLYHTAGLFDAGNGKLGLQSHLLELFVDEWMKFDIVFYLFIPCSINTELKPFSIYFESLDYFRSCFDFDLGCCSDFHIDSKVQPIYKCFASPPTAEAVGIQSEGGDL